MIAGLPAMMLLHGQSEDALKQYFEGQKVQVELDMPATSDGIDLDVFPEGDAQINYDDYAKRLKRYGISIHDGDQVLVTKIKVKKNMIEFQLGGGGYGTFGDSTDTSVHFTPTPKSKREKDLEDQLDKENDSRRRDRIRSELHDLRWRREREDSRRRQAAIADADRRAQEIQARREQGGSRFNLHYGSNVTPADLTPENIMAALSRVVRFSDLDTVSDNETSSAGPSAPQGGISALKKGMSRTDVEQILGSPASMKESTEGSMNLLTCTYRQGNVLVTAVYYDEILLRYTITSE
jgi:hypothetical protein